MINIQIGGVPEHFNLPLRELLDSGALAADGIQAVWHDYPGGSGAMLAALAEAALDVALLLTEAAVAGRAQGAAIEIVSRYTDSPLLWGIHVPGGSRYQRIEDIRGARYAISRYGSGSHLMAFAHARHLGWPPGELNFVEVGSLDGAIEAFEHGSADVFFWEKFMTLPVVESGRFRRLGEYAAPWPAFVVCASRAAWQDRGHAIETLVERALQTAQALAAAPDAVARISRRYGLRAPDVEQWLGLTRWSPRLGLDEADLAVPARVLRDAGLI